ncbi:hypothetical protein [Mycolicibacter longobardus]|nr:hypothetical protein [Mycolicibacter longobardus]MCV7384305.1 hypothetical protein [Mycolicibacter longobardus]
MKDKDRELTDLLNRVAAEAEATIDQPDDGQPLPPHVKVSRPNRLRRRVRQVRLNPDELESLERLAARRGLVEQEKADRRHEAGRAEPD